MGLNTEGILFITIALSCIIVQQYTAFTSCQSQKESKANFPVI